MLFEDIDLTISKGDKIALIAKNGSGKSTLLRVVAGEDSPEGERAKITRNKHIRIGYTRQEPKISEKGTILDAVLDTDNEQILVIKEYEQSLMLNDERAIERNVEKIEDLKAWDIEVRIKEILSRLNINDLSEETKHLSGGEKKRIALAKMIIDTPDFFILDEPTNHLDIDMIEWLESYLQTSKLTILMVTHDRYFLERVCNHIIELDKGKLFPYSGNYSDYLEKKAIRMQIESTTLDKSKKLLLKELEWIRRQPKARGTKAKSRVSEFHKIKEKVSSITYEEAFQIQLNPTRLGKKILELNDVSMAFDEKVILQNFWYKFRKGERIGIAGPNGAGKTTLINILTGAIKPVSGKIVLGSTVVFGHYKQDGLDMSKEHRVIDHVRQYADYIPLKKGLKLAAERLLETFMFPRPQQLVYISQLSGGERKRLHLLSVLMQNPNFLILDEPTNDLDILTLNVLESYLRQFPGCLVIVSHDRFFMDKLVDHMFIMDGKGNVKDYNGTYTEWKESRPKARENQKSKSNSKAGMASIDSFTSKKIKRQPKPARRTGRADRRSVAEAVERQRPLAEKLSYLERKELEQLENEIETLEAEKKSLEKDFLKTDLPARELEKMSIELGSINTSIKEKELRWLELSEYS